MQRGIRKRNKRHTGTVAQIVVISKCGDAAVVAVIKRYEMTRAVRHYDAANKTTCQHIALVMLL